MRIDNLEELRAAAGPLSDVLSWFDDRFGPFCRLSVERGLSGGLPWWVCSCDIARVPPGAWFNQFPTSAAGTSLSVGEAMRRGLGEAVERYSALYAASFDTSFPAALGESPYYQSYPRCSIVELAPFQFQQFAEDWSVSHSQVNSLWDGSPTIVPTSYLHLGFTPKQHEVFVAPPISTGLAFHIDQSAALRAGIFEVIERHCIMAAWLLQRANGNILLERRDCPSPIIERVRRLEHVGQACSLIDITDEELSIPAVLCLLRGPNYPYAVVGAACAADPERAVCKAIDEAVSVRSFAMARQFDLPSEALTNYAWVQSLEAHALLYAHWPHSPAFAFFDELPLEPFSEFASRYQTSLYAQFDPSTLARKMRELGYHVLWKDITTPDARRFGSVVKVVIPEAVPLSQTYATRWLATPKLLEGMRRLNLDAFPNPYPHPFA